MTKSVVVVIMTILLLTGCDHLKSGEEHMQPERELASSVLQHPIGRNGRSEEQAGVPAQGLRVQTQNRGFRQAAPPDISGPEPILCWEPDSYTADSWNIYRSVSEVGPWVQINNAPLPPSDKPYYFVDIGKYVAEPNGIRYYALQRARMQGPPVLPANVVRASHPMPDPFGPDTWWRVPLQILPGTDSFLRAYDKRDQVVWTMALCYWQEDILPVPADNLEFGLDGRSYQMQDVAYLILVGPDPWESRRFEVSGQR